MENQHYDLAEAEFSKEGKVILWIVAGFFLVAAVFILFRVFILGNKDIQATFAFVPLGISLFVTLIAYYATAKRKDLYFSITDDKIEFRFGIINPKVKLFKWVDIKELVVPSKQKRVMLNLNDGSFLIINLKVSLKIFTKWHWKRTSKSPRLRCLLSKCFFFDTEHAFQVDKIRRG